MEISGVVQQIVDFKSNHAIVVVRSMAGVRCSFEFNPAKVVVTATFAPMT